MTVPALGSWRPELHVSVVIPAYKNQAALDLTLASLSRQTYPAELFDVLVVDDASDPPLRLPDIRPARTRLIRADEHTKQRGIAGATNLGVQESSGQIIFRLDSDMVVFPEHIEAHARWHHALPYAVTLGAKRFVDVRPGGPGWPTPASVAAAGGVARLFDPARTQPHVHIEELLERTDQLRTADHLVFRAHVGATVALRRVLFDAAGGFNSALHRGSDTEFGYRLLQAGALFVPEPDAAAWHLGPSTIMRDKESTLRYSRPFTVDLVPYPRWTRRPEGRGWAVPLVTAVVTADGQPLEQVRATVDSVLANRERDLRVLLIGRWAELTEAPRAYLDDPLLDLRLVEATYRSDPRVRLVGVAPATAFPSPFLLRVPATVGLAAWSIDRLISEADERQAGLVRAALPDGRAVELWRTSALGRAAWVHESNDQVTDTDEARLAVLRPVVAEVYGQIELRPAAAGIADLAAGPHLPFESAAGRRRRLPTTVEVGGVRSLGRAAAVVVRISLHRVASRVRRAVRR